MISTLVVALATMVVLACRELLHHRRIQAHGRALMRLAAGAALVAVPLLAYPAWYALAGPQHVTGPTQSITAAGIDPLSTVFPVDGQLVAGLLPAWRTTPVPVLGDTGFLGIPLLMVLGYVAVTGWRMAVVRSVTVMGLVSWVLALGPRLVLRGHVTGIPLPFAFATRVPVLQDLIPSRLTLYVHLAAAVLLAVGVDRLCAHWARWAGWRRFSYVAAVAGSLALVIPAETYATAGIGDAKVFATSGITRQIPAGGVVLTYPYPIFPEDQAMLWQAVSGMRFSISGATRCGPREPADTKPRFRPCPLRPLSHRSFSTPGPKRRSPAPSRPARPTLGPNFRYSSIGTMCQHSSSR